MPSVVHFPNTRMDLQRFTKAQEAVKYQKSSVEKNEKRKILIFKMAANGQGVCNLLRVPATRLFVKITAVLKVTT